MDATNSREHARASAFLVLASEEEDIGAGDDGKSGELIARKKSESFSLFFVVCFVLFCLVD